MSYCYNIAQLVIMFLSSNYNKNRTSEENKNKTIIKKMITIIIALQNYKKLYTVTEYNVQKGEL